MIKIIGIDGDDTLWHNETTYRDAASKLEELLRTHYGLLSIDGEIYETEKENLHYFGYGVKSYTISMIETAVRLTKGRIEGHHVAEIAGIGKEMLSKELLLMDGVESVLAGLKASYPLILITKGDQYEQERKVERSGLAPYFDGIEIVSEKSTEGYASLLSNYGCDAASFVMVGNSLRSDILPVIKVGGRAVYIPYELTWEHETIVDEPLDKQHYVQIEDLSQLPNTLEELDR